MKIFKLIKSSGFVLIVFVFFPLLALYLATAPLSVYWQDSGIYLAGIKTMGVIYPPGYPLYLILARIWVNVVGYFFGTIRTFAWYVHSFSALMGALSGYFVAISVYKLINWVELVVKKGDKKYVSVGKNTLLLISICVGLTSGFSYSLWAQSINSEVYSMVGLTASVIFYLFINIVIDNFRSEKENREVKNIKKLMILALVFGLSFANHPLAFIMAIPILFFLLTNIGIRKIQELGDRKITILVSIFIISAVLPYSLLFIRTKAEPYYLWNKVDSFASLIYQVTGKEYYQTTSPVGISMSRFYSFFVLFFQEFFVVATVMVGLGMYRLRKLNSYSRKLFSFVVVFCVTFYAASLMYKSGGSEYNFWLIPVYNLLYIVAGVGLWYLWVRVQRNYIKGLVVILLITTPLAVNINYNRRENYRLAQEFGKNILAFLPPNSILFTIGDQDTSITKYLQLVEGFRPDIAILRPPDFNDYWRIQHLKKYYSFLNVPDIPERKLTTTDQRELLRIFIDENITENPIYLIQKSIIDTSDYEIVPAGTLFKLNKKNDGAIDLKDWEYNFSDPQRYKHPERVEGARKVYDAYGNVSMLRQKYSDEAKNFEMQAYKNLGDICLNKAEKGGYLRVITTDGKPDQWTGTRLYLCAKDSYEKILNVDKTFYNEGVYLSLSRSYEGLGMKDEADNLYNQVLKKRMAD